ncbi:MAG: hypothetical protein E7387_04860 [Ruminococcaceae bacterium]|nr:hypothetical protein [Oscillospiraceae bacterium]
MKKIDLDSWERKSHYQWFASFADPTVALDVKMDITKLLRYCAENKLSSYALIMYIACQCINDNQAFCLRVLNGEVIEIDSANVAYTILTNEKVFVNCRATLKNGFDSYMYDIESNQKKYNNQSYVQEKFNDIAIIDDIYCSCVPWVNFLSVKQPIPDKSCENRSIPRVCWGKYYTENDRIFVTLNITADHALVDGKDLSDVINDIQKAFDNIEDYINSMK